MTFNIFRKYEGKLEDHFSIRTTNSFEGHKCQLLSMHTLSWYVWFRDFLGGIDTK